MQKTIIFKENSKQKCLNNKPTKIEQDFNKRPTKNTFPPSENLQKNIKNTVHYARNVIY